MIRAATVGLLLTVGCVATGAPAPSGGAAIIVLGTAQDAGRPHLGCFKDCCETLRGAGRAERVASLGVRGDDDRWWLVDATPDLPAQVHAMGSAPAGILLTHAHVGHYTGLMYLGREGAHAISMPVHCSVKMAAFLRENAPWDQLVRIGNLDLRPFRTGETVELGGGVRFTSFRVPHRDEYADTHAFGLHGAGEPLLYLPDIDRWEDWSHDHRRLAASYPAWLVDGSFYSGDELGGRDMSEIPHPTVRHTMDLFGEEVAAGRMRVWFTHLNHTNPLWDPESDAAREVAGRGFHVARTGQQFRSGD